MIVINFIGKVEEESEMVEKTNCGIRTKTFTGKRGAHSKPHTV